MALSSNNSISWADVQAIYTNINTTRTKFRKTALTIPANTGTQVSISNLTTLNSFMTEMKTYTTAFGAKPLASVATGITAPTAGTLAKPTQLTTLANQAVSAAGTCYFDSFNSFSQFDFSEFSFSEFSFSEFSFGSDFSFFQSFSFDY